MENREKQYAACGDDQEKYGLQSLGVMCSSSWINDPKHLVFVLSRYKFVAKMFSGMARVLEVGCGDAFASRIVSQEVGELLAVDFDPVFIADAKSRAIESHGFNCSQHDILDGPVAGTYDGIFSLDVLEHISEENENIYLTNLVRSLGPHGCLIIGTPTIQSQVHASRQSREGHVNCKDHKQLKELLRGYLNNVFLFSMHDEVVHTGFYPMAHYLLALCTSPDKL